MIVEIIKCAQAGDQEAMLELVNKFLPLLKKYSYKLGYEDSLEDLQLDFITLICAFKTDKLRDKTDGAVVNFIVRSIHNAYVKLLKVMLQDRVNSIHFEDMTGCQQYMTTQDITIDTDAVNFRKLLDICDRLTSQREVCFGKGLL